MRIGVFGGSFDPIHYGHLLLAERCREQRSLDRVLFMPASVSPLKTKHPPGAAKDRVEMLRLAIGGHAAFEVSTLELDRGGVSYTIDTLTALRESHANDALFFLMGADSLRDFALWRDPQRICELAVPLVVRRRGSPEPQWNAFAPFASPERIEEIRESVIDMPILELSSSELRERIAVGRSIRYCTPAAVERYIAEQKLYRAIP